jgi:hypothetical protein
VQSWTKTQVALAVIAVGLFGLVAVLAFMALDPNQQDCVSGEIGGAPEVEVEPEAALSEFVTRNAELYPLEGWTVQSNEGDITVFTNDDGGDFTLTVTAGSVTAFERCET